MENSLLRSKRGVERGIGSDDSCVRTLGGVNLSRQIEINRAAEYRMVVNGVVLIWEFQGPINSSFDGR